MPRGKYSNYGGLIMSDTTNMSEIVRKAFEDSLYKQGDNMDTAVSVEGLVHTYMFNPERLKEMRASISEVVAMLPERFHAGDTFLNLCKTQNDELWTGDQTVCEQLVVMAIGLGLMEYCFSREVWRMLPGGVPYIIVR